MNPATTLHPVKVSVLIPVYNGAPFLAETIASVKAQTFNDFELIITDDGSTDGSQDIVREYARQDSRIIFVQNERNLGCVKNINLLALFARGEYLKFLIQDDVLAPNCLEVCAGILDNHPEVLLVTSYQKFIGDRSDVRKLPTLPAIGKLDGKRVQRHVLQFGNWIGGETAVMFRHKSLTAGLFNPDWVWQVDQDMWLRILADGDLYVVSQILTFSRVHRNQNTFLLNKGFTFVREELMQLKAAFMSPNIYGSYTKAEQRALYKAPLLRLIKKGLAEHDAQLRQEMIEIGRSIGHNEFWLLLGQVYWNDLVAKLLRYSGVPRLVDYIGSHLARRLRGRSWKRRFQYRACHKDVDIGFGIVRTDGSIRVPMTLLRSPIMTPVGFKVVMIEETPHYAWIKDLVEGNDDTVSRQAYRTYLNLYHLDEGVEENIKKVMNLVDSLPLEIAQGHYPTIVTHPPSQYGGELCVVIYDGNHRACIMKTVGQCYIDCRVVGIEMTSDYFPPNFFETQE